MRILQVVTYISPDGAYGGPVRVAINQAKALHDRGHDVIVVAAAGGFDGPLPDEYDGFPVRLFPVRRVLPKTGFAGLTSPRLLAWLAEAIREADVVHVHLARDFVTLPAAALALIARKPLVVQTHGMIDHTDKRLAAPLDRFLTRPVLRAARSVLYLTEREHHDLEHVAGERLHLVHLPNGVAFPKFMAVEQMKGPQVDPEVLYLARLHPRKRPMLFIRAAKSLASQFPDVRFTLIGPDEGEGNAVRRAVQGENSTGKVTWIGPIAPERTLERMAQSSVYVLPSTDEPFPMSVLEAMSLGLPVVITESCGLASVVQAHEAGIVCSDDPNDIKHAVAHLLTDVEARCVMGAKARQVIEQQYSMASVAHALSSVYDTAKKDRRPKHD